jgi:hypothetical protein
MGVPGGEADRWVIESSLGLIPSSLGGRRWRKDAWAHIRALIPSDCGHQLTAVGRGADVITPTRAMWLFGSTPGTLEAYARGNLGKKAIKGMNTDPVSS